MGKKLVAVFVTIACACTLCLALVGCGGGDPKANFTGAWELETIEDADLGTVDTAILKQMNMPVNMTLNEDGSADFVMFGQSIDATWTANSATQMTLTLAGEGDAIFTLAEGKLTSDDDLREGGSGVIASALQATCAGGPVRRKMDGPFHVQAYEL